MQQTAATGRPVIFGEVLFDHFPDGSAVLGGAPFNVAWHLRGFGERPCFISRVGDDPNGQRVRAAMADWDMDLAGLQTDARHPTGSVRIALQGGDARFEILADQAYDHIALAEVPDLERPALLYHGSLALRHATSRDTLGALIARNDIPVYFDVNLRPPWWAEGDVLRWTGRADWVKLNQDELALLSPEPADMGARARGFLARYALQGVLLTLGKDGALLLTATGALHGARPEATVQVVDTVGAGDAFTAVFLLGQLRGWPSPLTLERAQRFASAIVGVRGATVADRAFYRAFLDDWA